jgi:N-acetylmuramoyl-L-alanine amidase
LSHRSTYLFCHAVVAAAALVILSSAGVRLAGQAPGSPLTLLSREGRRSLPVIPVGDQELLALDDLATAFQLAVREETGAVTVSYRGRTIVLTPNQPLASVAGRLVSLPAPLTRSNNRWLVPLEFVNRALAPIYETRLELRRPSRLVVIGDLRVPRVTVTADTSANTTRLTVDATPAATSAITQETGRLIIRFEADALDAFLPPVVSPGLVQGLRIADATAIAVDVGPRFASFRASTQATGNTARLVLEVLGAATETSAPPTPPPAAPPRPEAPAATPELPVFGQPAMGLRTITIDPGHGGDDVGARGGNGTVEKDLTLAVASRLKALVEGRLGIRVLMTREDDRSIPLNERISLANNNKADVFISLHANASPRPAAGGASIYVAEFDARDQTQTLTPERVPVFGGGLRDIELVLWDFAQSRHIEQSAELARIVEDSLRGRVGVEVRPVDRAPFRVLESANMPAILIEMGFLSNPDQEKVLGGAAFQNAFAQSVFDALLRFRGHLSAAAGEP